MLRQSRQRLKSGNAAQFFAISLVPLLMAAGFGVDYNFAQNGKQKAQAALDAAILAGTRGLNMEEDDAQIRHQVEKIFRDRIDEAGLTVDCKTFDTEIDHKEHMVSAEVYCATKTSFGGILGLDRIGYWIDSAAMFGVQDTDVSFMFDVSGSMSGAKIASLKTAATEAVNILLPTSVPPSGGSELRVALTSYSYAVNAGDYFEDVTGTPPSGTNTCVQERAGTEAFTDAEPDIGAWIEAPATYCPTSTPQPLTTSNATLVSKINALSTGGMTAGHQGIAWAWYLLSPEWSDIWPAGSDPLPYNHPDGQKIAVLMTDGAFNQFHVQHQGNSRQQAEELCDNMKDEDVIIYSVAFQAPASGQQILEYCATSTATYFDASNSSELIEAYQQIAQDIKRLHLKR